MFKTTVYLDPEVALCLRQLSEVEGRPQAEIIRHALAAYTRRAARPKPKGIGLYRSGRTDVSQKSEELLRRAIKARRWP